MLRPFLLPLLLLTCFPPSFAHSMKSSTSKCSNSNSNMSIPYPFGIAGQSPSPAQGFEIKCGSSGPILSIKDNVFGILNISLLDGFVSILATATSQQCKGNSSYSSFSLEGTNFTFSDTRNKFTAVGCDVVAMLLNGSSGYSGGCASFCPTDSSIINGTCSGVACCEAPVPKGLKKLDLEFTNITRQLVRPNKYNNTLACREAFIVEQNSYVFSRVDLNNTAKNSPQYRPVVLEWSIDGGSCEEAKHSASYACKENSDCYNSTNGIGYRCNCTLGYQGNPYLQGPGGCQDMDECSIKSPCMHKCINTEGSFYCICPAGMGGDGLKGESGCNGVGTLLIAIGKLEALSHYFVM